MFDTSALTNKARYLVAKAINESCDRPENEHLREDEVFIVWFCKTLQNWKAICSTTRQLDRIGLYEVTYNGDKQEAYVDAYKKLFNVCIYDNEVVSSDKECAE